MVFAPEAMDLVNHHLAYYHEVATSPQNVTLLLDSDSQMFLNYLYQPIDDGYGDTEDFLNELKAHGELIQARLKEFSGEPSIWSKYAWAGGYHNHFCAHFPSAEKFKIDTDSLSQAPRFLSEVYKRKGNKMFFGDKEVATLKLLPQWDIETKPE